MVTTARKSVAPGWWKLGARRYCWCTSTLLKRDTTSSRIKKDEQIIWVKGHFTCFSRNFLLHVFINMDNSVSSFYRLRLWAHICLFTHQMRKVKRCCFFSSSTERSRQIYIQETITLNKIGRTFYFTFFFKSCPAPCLRRDTTEVKNFLQERNFQRRHRFLADVKKCRVKADFNHASTLRFKKSIKENLKWKRRPYNVVPLSKKPLMYDLQVAWETIKGNSLPYQALVSSRVRKG